MEVERTTVHHQPGLTADGVQPLLQRPHPVAEEPANGRWRHHPPAHFLHHQHDGFPLAGQLIEQRCRTGLPLLWTVLEVLSEPGPEGIDQQEAGAPRPAVEVPILQFPVWLAFAGSPTELALEDDLL